MTESDLIGLTPRLDAFHKRFQGFFCRSESRKWSIKYLQGLMIPIEQKNVENIAEEVAAPPRKLQEFLSDSPWDDEGCIEEHQRFVGERFGAPNGVVIFDDTGFPKKGDKSAGVGRQYSGTMDKTYNCQVGVFMSYASVHGHTLADRRLYILSQWFEEAAAGRRKRVCIPRYVRFKTKTELAMEMLDIAHERGNLLFQWVSGDCACGDAYEFRKHVAEMGRGGECLLAIVHETRRLLWKVLPRMTGNLQDVIAWFMKQRHNKQRARNSHKKKLLKDHPS